MFNGIIKNTGKIRKVYKRNNNCIIEISSKMKFAKNEVGSSISCSGACLTVEKYKRNYVKFYVSKETLNKTKELMLKQLEASDILLITSASLIFKIKSLFRIGFCLVNLAELNLNSFFILSFDRDSIFLKTLIARV